MPPIGSNADAIKWWVSEVEKRTKGAVTIKVYWGGTLAKTMEIPEAVRTGTADMGDTIWGSAFLDKFGLYAIADWPIPFQRKTLAVWLAVEQLGKEFPEFGETDAACNVKRLTLYGPDTIHVVCRKPITRLEDFKGLKMRCSGAQHTTLLKSVGATPSYVPTMQAYDVIQKGVVDGSTSGVFWMRWYKLAEVAKYFTRIPLGGMPSCGAMINLDVWNKLPQSVQQVFNELREEYPFVAGKMGQEESKECYEYMEKMGVKIIDMPAADIETWKNLPEVKKLSEDWISHMVKHSKISESRLREMLKRHIALYEEYSKRYPMEW
jgi:TRAP-type C4-dicarboxylate transport system substrate-binding protein